MMNPSMVSSFRSKSRLNLDALFPDARKISLSKLPDNRGTGAVVDQSGTPNRGDSDECMSHSDRTKRDHLQEGKSKFNEPLFRGLLKTKLKKCCLAGCLAINTLMTSL